MKLYDYGRKRNKGLKDIQWDQIDEEIRRIWDALYNRREQYPNQLGGGISPFEATYGLTGAAGLRYTQILARMPRGNHQDVNNKSLLGLPLVIAYPSLSFTVNLIAPFPATSVTDMGIVIDNYYGVLHGFSIPALTAGVNGVIMELVGPNTAGGLGSRIYNLPGGGSADNSRLKILLDKDEFIRITVTKAAAGGNVTVPIGFLNCLFFARWPLGEPSPGALAVNQLLGTTGPGINNVKFVRLQNVATLANTDFTIYTCPAGKVAWVDKNYIGYKNDGYNPNLGTITLRWKTPANLNSLVIQQFAGGTGSFRAMDTYFSTSMDSSGNREKELPILEAGDSVAIRYSSNPGNANIFFHVYERDIETLEVMTDPISGETFSVGGVDPF